MNSWNLASRSGFYHIDGTGVEETVAESDPLLIDPSITFRKHFELPTGVDRDPETLRLELFSRFLPADLDQYVCQFQDGTLTDNDARRVLGLAIKETDLKWLEGIHGEDTPKYILENLLEPPSGQSDVYLELSLPEGLYAGVFKDGFLTWSRYLKEGDQEEDSEREATRTYVEDEFPDVETVAESPPFRTDEAGEWIEFSGNWIQDDPSEDRVVRRDLSRDLWSRWRSTAWTLLSLALLTTVVWWGYNYVTIRNHQNWTRQQAERFLGSSSNPLDSLESSLGELRSTLETTEESRNVYPRIAQVDSVLAESDVHLLQLKISGSQGQLVFVTNSLESAENLKDSFLDAPGISRSEIVSTNPQEEGEYQFKVNMNVLWEPVGRGNGS